MQPALSRIVVRLKACLVADWPQDEIRKTSQVVCAYKKHLLMPVYYTYLLTRSLSVVQSPYAETMKCNNRISGEFVLTVDAAVSEAACFSSARSTSPDDNSCRVVLFAEHRRYGRVLERNEWPFPDLV